MPKTHFIAGDWGTSNLRLYLCEFLPSSQVKLIDTRLGSGILEISGDFEDRFFNLAQDWVAQHGQIPVILSGMVGSNIGWKEAPYTSCPAGADEIASGRVSFNARGLEFSILSGLRATNPLHESDVMRGEELQMLGWLLCNQGKDSKRQLFSLPGTHNKWALMENRKIQTFLTAFTGELFALLSKKSILISDNSAINLNQSAFMEGVKVIENLGSAHLLHALFSVRSRQVLGEMASADGLSYLSGLIIADDIFGALGLFADVTTVTVIGEPTLSKQYKVVLDYLGINSQCSDPAHIAAAGYAVIYQSLYT